MSSINMFRDNLYMIIKKRIIYSIMLHLSGGSHCHVLCKVTLKYNVTDCTVVCSTDNCTIENNITSQFGEIKF